MSESSFSIDIDPQAATPRQAQSRSDAIKTVKYDQARYEAMKLYVTSSDDTTNNVLSVQAMTAFGVPETTLYTGSYPYDPGKPGPGQLPTEQMPYPTPADAFA